MDIVLDACDQYFLTPYVYPATWREDWLVRQVVSLYFIAAVGGWLLYFAVATLSYLLIFDHGHKQHQQFLPNQAFLEISYASKSIPVMAIFTVPLFVLEIHGYSKLYMGISGFGEWAFIAFSVFLFLMFTDGLIYWIHRFLHHRLVYKYLHKDHHKWKIPTPYSSHAFHPVDGFLQSLPYHIYPFIFPLHKVAYLLLFVFVNVWTVSIHDGDYRVPKIFQPFINGSAHHTEHHLLYKYNYGQFFTLWDRIGCSFHYPRAFDGLSLLQEIEQEQKEK